MPIVPVSTEPTQASPKSGAELFVLKELLWQHQTGTGSVRITKLFIHVSLMRSPCLGQKMPHRHHKIDLNRRVFFGDNL
ncbi:MAG: hypothetical protein DWH94_01800 [Planctomycetota bacterium]|nr:MAG: hypothetical protein DWH80_04355 [Planctomycetota bacterium]RLS60967.1 MAG: hypothetical protein DWH94_01800 [Planctomycetota bacterium]